MKRDNDKIRTLYRKLHNRDLTRAGRQEIMEEIKRERYKSDPRKPISQKGQAVCNVIYGAILMAAPIVSKLTQSDSSGSGSIGGDIFFIATIVIVSIMAVMMYSRKAEPADELCKELMLKATSWSAPILIAVVWLTGLIMKEGVYTVTTDDMALLVILLMGVYLTARYAIYLWLDRTPASDDEED